VIGTTWASGTFEGKDAFVNWAQMTMARVDVETGFDFHFDNLIAEGAWVVAQFRGKARSKTGNDYNNTYCIVYRIVDGKIKETWSTPIQNWSPRRSARL
jgi:uncharacterized protein